MKHLKLATISVLDSVSMVLLLARIFTVFLRAGFVAPERAAAGDVQQPRAA